MDTPALDLLLKGYFHEDYAEDFGDERGTVQGFLDGEPELVDQLIADIDAVLTHCRSDAEVETWVLARRSPYRPDPGVTFTQWLGSIRQQVLDSQRHGVAADGY